MTAPAKSARLNVRVTPEQLDAVNEDAESLGISAAHLVKLLIDAYHAGNFQLLLSAGSVELVEASNGSWGFERTLA